VQVALPATADVAVLPPRCTINEIAALQDCLRAASVVALGVANALNLPTAS
jgi:hypothetical protein